MQHSALVLLALLLAHVLADFPLQTSRMVEGKGRRDIAAFASHLGMHLVAAIACLFVFTDVPLMRYETGIALLLLVTGHGLLDLAKSIIIEKSPRLDNWWMFLADQMLHVVILLAVATILPEVTLELRALERFWDMQRDRILTEAFVITVFVFPTGYLIRYLLEPLSIRLKTSGEAPSAETGLANAGLYLGWIERSLLLYAFTEASITAVGLIVGAKSVVRFPEFQTRAFAEYFLLGSLLSVGVAAIGALALTAARSLVS
ncbi:MAG: DUF3307 domain-containing protein [Pseudomonadota bacterium]